MKKERKTIVYMCAFAIIFLSVLYTAVIVNKLQMKEQATSTVPTTTEKAENTFKIEFDDLWMLKRHIPHTETETEPVTEEKSYILDLPISEDIQEYLYIRCQDEDVEYALALAIIECESDFQIDNHSTTNDFGLFQINGSNYYYLQRDLGIDNLLDPYQNIDCGLHMLKEYWTEDIHHTLMCYNAGATVGNYWWSTGTRSTYYTERVVSKRDYYREVLD